MTCQYNEIFGPAWALDEASTTALWEQIDGAEWFGEPPDRSGFAELRRQLLEENGVLLPDDLSEGGLAPADDVLDAAAAAWTVNRLAQGRAKTLPDPRRSILADGRSLSCADRSCSALIAMAAARLLLYVRLMLTRVNL